MPVNKWFAAHLIFRSQVGAGPEPDPLCEDRVVLFHAPDEEHARAAATRYGLRDRGAYRNEIGTLVRWEFAGVDDLEELGSGPEPEGWEVAARHFRPSDIRRERARESREQ